MGFIDEKISERLGGRSFGYISVVPWDDAGAYLRFSVTFEAGSEQEERSIINEMKNRLSNLKLTF